MNKFHVGLVGAGLIGRDHAITLSNLPQVKQLSIFDQDAKRAQQVAEEFNAQAVASLRELIDNCDIVWICTPPFVRREPIQEACRAGKPIFCEKPFAITAKECGALEAIIHKAGVPFFMGQSGRYSSFFVKMKSLVEQGVVGTPTTVWCTRLGQLDPRTAPAWRLDDSLSGGTVIELGVHEIDFLRWIGGDWQSVYARGSSDILVPGEFQDTVSAIGTLANGATARLSISWASPRYLWQRGVEGTEGSLFFDDSNVREVVLHRPGKTPKIHKTGDWQNHETKENLSLRDQTMAVLKTLANGGAPPVTMDDGIAAVQAALAMRESARSGRVVQIKQKI